jgi:hypothetical protein
MTNSEFRSNTGSGLRLANAAVSIVNCKFHNNSLYGIHQNVVDTVVYSDNTFMNNGQASVGIEGGGLPKSTTWSMGGGDPFNMVLISTVTVPAEVTLTVAPGVNLRLAQHQGLYVDGSLVAVGSQTLPISIQGSTPNAGWWRGVQVRGSGSGQFEYCDLAHGGWWDGVTLLKSGSGNLTLRQSTIRDGGADGLRLNGSIGLHEVFRTRFHSNARGVRLTGQLSSLALTGSHFEGNSQFGVQNQTAVEVDARNSWWGSVSGPLHPTKNSNGTGDPVSDLVLFDPWQLDDELLGTLVVTLDPETVRESGARWRVGSGAWQESGASMELNTGNHLVQLLDVAGWKTPGPRTVEIVEGEALQLTVVYELESVEETQFVSGPTLSSARMGHHGVTLPDGRIVLFGGHGMQFKSLNTAEVWSEGAEDFSVLTMNYTHDAPAFARLPDGQFLLAGGSADLGVPRYATSEVFNPETDSFTTVGQTVRFRASSSATALADGRVLLAGAWWTHNDAHTYGELFEPETGTFEGLINPNMRRAYAVLLPANDGSAVHLGGVGVTGGAPIQAVEAFDPETGTWSVLQESLLDDGQDWALFPEQKIQEDYLMADGRYLYLAYRDEGEVRYYTLLTFDPATRALAAFDVQPPLPTGDQYWLRQPVVDAARGVAHLLVQHAGSDPVELRVLTVELATRTWHETSGSLVLNPAYVLSGSVVNLMADGRLFLSGGSQDGTNFHPVPYTWVITPGSFLEILPVRIELAIAEDGDLILSWPDTAGNAYLETSVNLKVWVGVEGNLERVHGYWMLKVNPLDAARFFRLRRSATGT